MINISITLAWLKSVRVGDYLDVWQFVHIKVYIILIIIETHRLIRYYCDGLLAVMIIVMSNLKLNNYNASSLVGEGGIQDPRLVPPSQPPPSSRSIAYYQYHHL